LELHAALIVVDVVRVAIEVVDGVKAAFFAPFFG
jgi:hypothetical protein